MGTMAEFLQHSQLKEHPEYPSARAMVEELMNDHESVVRFLRQSIDRCDGEFHDVSTSDFLTGLMREHEKMAWMLRAHLEGQ